MRKYKLLDGISEAEQELSFESFQEGRIKVAPFFRAVTPLFPQIPKFSPNIPLGVIVSPGKIGNVPSIDYTNQYIVKCTNCYSYLCCYSFVAEDNKTWICPICGSRATCPKNFNRETNPEVKFNVYDMIVKKKLKEPFIPIIAIAIDISKKAVDCGLTTHFVKALKVILPTMKKDISVVILTYGTSISVYDGEKKQCLAIPDSENPEIPYISFAPLSETLEYYLGVCDALLKIPGQFGNNYHLLLMTADKLLENRGGVFVVSLAGCPSCITPRTGTEDEIIMFPDDQSFYPEKSYDLNEESISVSLFCSLDLEKNEELVVTAVPPGLTGGHVQLYDEKGDYHTLVRDLSYILNDNYFWKANARIKVPRELRVIGYHSNCVINETGEISFGAFSANDAIAYEIEIIPNQKLNEIIAIQVQFEYISLEGSLMMRVFTFNYKTTSGSIEQYIDRGALTALSLKKAVKGVLDNGLLATRRSIEARPPRFAPLLQEDHQLKTDGRVRDLVFIRGSGVIDCLLYLSPRKLVLEKNAVLIHHPRHIDMLIAKEANREFMQAVFGQETIANAIPELETPENQKIREFINESRSMSLLWLPLTIKAE